MLAFVVLKKCFFPVHSKLFSFCICSVRLSDHYASYTTTCNLLLSHIKNSFDANTLINSLSEDDYLRSVNLLNYCCVGSRNQRGKKILSYLKTTQVRT